MITSIKLDQEWSYHWGDFELDAQGRPVGFENPAAWTPYPATGLEPKGARAFLWLKRALPEPGMTNPALFIPPSSIRQSFEIYLDQALMYKAGDMRPIFANSHIFITWHLVALPDDYAGKTLFLRICSAHPVEIGILKALTLGPHQTLFEHILLDDLDLTILGLLAMIAGVAGYGALIAVYARRNRALFGFATMATFSGLYLLADTSRLFQMVVTPPRLLAYAWNGGFFLFMAGIYLFCEATIGIRRRWAYRACWQFQAGCLAVFLVCDLAGTQAINPYDFSIIGASVGVLIGGVDTLKLLRQRQREARILSVGFGVFAASGLLSMWAGRVSATLWEPYPYGLLVLHAALAYLLILRYQAERRQAIESVRQSEERLAGIVGALTDALVMIDARGLIVWVNAIATAVLGADLVNRSYRSVTPGEPDRPDFQAIAACLHTGQAQEYEVGFAAADGARRDYWGVVNVVTRQANGRPAVVIQVLRDITGLKRLQGEAARITRLAALGELAAGVAHEINNPLSGVIGYAEILAEDAVEQGASPEIPALILKEGKRVAKIVGSLLTFARQRQPVLKPARMEDILADALLLTAKLFQKSAIVVQCDLPPDLPRILADEQQIQQVVLNLLQNARYALETLTEHRTAKVVAITCQPIVKDARPYLRTIIHDNGVGIPANRLDKICDPFYTTKPNGEGTGLGLSISYGILKDHEGQLGFESQEGAYMKVCVDLPAIQDDEMV